MRYSILDPTGNITALVEARVPIADQPRVAANIMQLHPQVEQVGFVRYASVKPLESGADVSLRMAGGEFCGNATLAAAALARMHGRVQSNRVTLRVSGADELLEVRLTEHSNEHFAGSIRMPRALGITRTELSYGGLSDTVSVVQLEGISHVIIPTSSTLYALLDNPHRAERAVRTWCHYLSASGLGLMFVAFDDLVDRLTPLVYVPSGDTVFWEHSCASGSAAVAQYLADRSRDTADISLAEPGGTIHVHSDPIIQETWLYGSVRLVS